MYCMLYLLKQETEEEGGEEEMEEGEGDWGEGGGGGGGWETVTEEGEEWVGLQLRLQVLTSLWCVVGLAIMNKTPPLPLMRKKMGGETEEVVGERKGEREEQ